MSHYEPLWAIKNHPFWFHQDAALASEISWDSSTESKRWVGAQDTKRDSAVGKGAAAAAPRRHASFQIQQRLQRSHI